MVHVALLNHLNQAEAAILNSSQGRNCIHYFQRWWREASVSLVWLNHATCIMLYVHIYSYTYIHMPVYIYINLYIHIYIWIHVHCSIVDLWSSNGCASIILFKLFIWDLIWSSWTHLIPVTGVLVLSANRGVHVGELSTVSVPDRYILSWNEYNYVSHHHSHDVSVLTIYWSHLPSHVSSDKRRPKAFFFLKNRQF